jgi:hypothetical protein
MISWHCQRTQKSSSPISFRPFQIWDSDRRRILKQSVDLRGQTQAGGGVINELKQIDAMLAQIQERKLGVDPKDADALAAIRKEEEALLDRRAEAAKRIAAVESANANVIAQAKQQLQALEATAQNKGIDEENYNRQKQQLEATLQQAEREKAAFDAVAKTATQTAQNTADNFVKSNEQIEVSYNSGKRRSMNHLPKTKSPRNNLANDRCRLSKNTYSKSWS